MVWCIVGQRLIPHATDEACDGDVSYQPGGSAVNIKYKCFSFSHQRRFPTFSSLHSEGVLTICSLTRMSTLFVHHCFSLNASASDSGCVFGRTRKLLILRAPVWFDDVAIHLLATNCSCCFIFHCCQHFNFGQRFNGNQELGHDFAARLLCKGCLCTGTMDSWVCKQHYGLAGFFFIVVGTACGLADVVVLRA